MAVVAVDHDFGGASLRHDQAGRAPWEQSEEEEEIEMKDLSTMYVYDLIINK